MTVRCTFISVASPAGLGSIRLTQSFAGPISAEGCTGGAHATKHRPARQAKAKARWGSGVGRQGPERIERSLPEL